MDRATPYKPPFTRTELDSEFPLSDLAVKDIAAALRRCGTPAADGRTLCGMFETLSFRPCDHYIAERKEWRRRIAAGQ